VSVAAYSEKEEECCRTIHGYAALADPFYSSVSQCKALKVLHHDPEP